jgi:hypothetical protein
MYGRLLPALLPFYSYNHNKSRTIFVAKPYLKYATKILSCDFFPVKYTVVNCE